MMFFKVGAKVVSSTRPSWEWGLCSAQYWEKVKTSVRDKRNPPRPWYFIIGTRWKVRHLGDLRSFPKELCLFFFHKYLGILVYFKRDFFSSVLLFEGRYTYIYNDSVKKQKSPASWFKTIIVKHLEVKSNTEDLIPMASVVCIEYKRNQSRIVLSSMSTQQWMTFPGIILFKCDFQLKRACWIILDFPGMRMVSCPWRKRLLLEMKGMTPLQGAGVPPSAPQEWWGGKHLLRGMYLGFLQARSSLAQPRSKTWAHSSCGLLKLACIHLQDSMYTFRHFGN